MSSDNLHGFDDAIPAVLTTGTTKRAMLTGFVGAYAAAFEPGEPAAALYKDIIVDVLHLFAEEYVAEGEIQPGAMLDEVESLLTSAVHTHWLTESPFMSS